MTVIPISSDLYREIHRLAVERRLVFMAGLPGVGKSLLIQQLALVAHAAGRRIHLLRYNDARQPFETEDILARFPELDGVTDPIIRKGVGVWAREAVVKWAQANPDPRALLIGELPLIGGRLIELVDQVDDAAEPLLAGVDAEFVVPIPSWQVRAVIEKTRESTVAEPRNKFEKLDAPPNVMRLLWEEVNRVARETGLTKARPESPYNPYIYGGVYEMLLRHRPTTTLMINEILRPTQSVYALDFDVVRMQPTPEEAAVIIDRVEAAYPPGARSQIDEEWHSLITGDPTPPDPGPQLQLPLPEALLGVVGRTDLGESEKKALDQILALPLDAPAEKIIPVVANGIAILQETAAAENIRAGVVKFDVYDDYFNVVRGEGQEARLFLIGLLQSYRGVLENLAVPPASLTLVEQPLLRMALETTLRLFV